jgi:hypothetical protein
VGPKVSPEDYAGAGMLKRDTTLRRDWDRMVKLVPTIDPNELSGLVSHCYEIHRRDDMPESEVHMPQPAASTLTLHAPRVLSRCVW